MIITYIFIRYNILNIKQQLIENMSTNNIHIYKDN